MKRTLSVFVASCCVILLASCQRGIVYVMFNNTGQDITILSYDTKMEPKSYTVKHGTAVDVQTPFVLKVRIAGREWVYDDWKDVRVGKEFQYARPLGLIDERFQIESDGAIYVLPAAAERIASSFPQQPKGLPIRPRSN